MDEIETNEEEEYVQGMVEDYMTRNYSDYRRSRRQALFEELEELCEFYSKERSFFINEDDEKYPMERIEFYDNLKIIFNEFEKGFEKENDRRKTKKGE